MADGWCKPRRRSALPTWQVRDTHDPRLSVRPSNSWLVLFMLWLGAFLRFSGPWPIISSQFAIQRLRPCSSTGATACRGTIWGIILDQHPLRRVSPHSSGKSGLDCCTLWLVTTLCDICTQLSSVFRPQAMSSVF